MVELAFIGSKSTLGLLSDDDAHYVHYALIFIFVDTYLDSRREYLLLINSVPTRAINQHIHLPPFQVSGGFGFPSHSTRRRR
jgi:hypothetical protein